MKAKASYTYTHDIGYKSRDGRAYSWGECTEIAQHHPAGEDDPLYTETYTAIRRLVHKRKAAAEAVAEVIRRSSPSAQTCRDILALVGTGLYIDRGAALQAALDALEAHDIEGGAVETAEVALRAAILDNVVTAVQHTAAFGHARAAEFYWAYWARPLESVYRIRPMPDTEALEDALSFTSAVASGDFSALEDC